VSIICSLYLFTQNSTLQCACGAASGPHEPPDSVRLHKETPPLYTTAGRHNHHDCMWMQPPLMTKAQQSQLYTKSMLYFT
jgi:hypothetical protein